MHTGQEAPSTVKAGQGSQPSEDSSPARPQASPDLAVFIPTHETKVCLQQQEALREDGA
jgi:hypothetical protein